MTVITFDIYQTLAIAVVAMMIGHLVKKRIGLLERFCIPSPVIGGVIVALVICILHETGVAEIDFNDLLREVCMVFFFTSVGFQADFRLLKKGGKSLVVFLLLVIVVVILQNTVAVGTAAAFGPLLEKHGLSGASTICIACATYGLIAGSVIGGPILLTYMP